MPAIKPLVAKLYQNHKKTLDKNSSHEISGNNLETSKNSSINQTNKIIGENSDIDSRYSIRNNNSLMTNRGLVNTKLKDDSESKINAIKNESNVNDNNDLLNTNFKITSSYPMSNSNPYYAKYNGDFDSLPPENNYNGTYMSLKPSVNDIKEESYETPRISNNNVNIRSPNDNELKDHIDTTDDCHKIHITPFLINDGGFLTTREFPTNENIQVGSKKLPNLFNALNDDYIERRECLEILDKIQHSLINDDYE